MIGTLVAYAFWAGLAVVLLRALRAQFAAESDLARPQCHAAERALRSCSTIETEVITGVTARVLDYWASKGAFGPHLVGQGSGSRRRWRDRDLEVAWALGQVLAVLGHRHMDHLVDVLLERRVDPVGELLVITSTGDVSRVPRTGPLPVAEGLSVLHLRAYDGLELVPWAS